MIALGVQGVMLRDSGDFVGDVERMTEGRAVDVVADLVGGALFGKLLNVLRPERRYTTAGAIAGPVVQLDLRTMYLKQLQLNGSSQGTRGAFKRVLDYIQNGTIRPVLAASYPLSKFHDAQTRFMEKRFVGNIVVIPDRHYGDSVAR
ncbi:NADPH:quinone reductase-like Zn-dependent oxidoreductase [Paraburkholderia sp. MM5496-R1]